MTRETLIKPGPGEVIIIDPIGGSKIASAKTNRTKTRTTVTVAGEYVEPTPIPDPEPEPTPPPAGTLEGFAAGIQFGRGRQLIQPKTMTEMRSALTGVDRHIQPVFSGKYDLKPAIDYRGRNCTLDGSKAPGTGLTLSWDTVQIAYGASNFELCHVRLRGPYQTNPQEGDNISPTRGVSGIYIHHVSMSGFNDEGIGAWDHVTDMTISDCIIGPGQAANHRFAVIFGAGSERISFHHSILSGNSWRNPAVGWNGDANAPTAANPEGVVADCVGLTVKTDGVGLLAYENGTANFVDCWVDAAAEPVLAEHNGRAYVEGCEGPSGTLAVTVRTGGSRVSTPFAVPTANRVTRDGGARQSARRNFAQAGCRVGGLDAVDTAIIAGFGTV